MATVDCSAQMPAGSCKVIQDGGVPTVAPAGLMVTLKEAAMDKIKLTFLRAEKGFLYLQGVAGDAVFIMKVRLSALGEISAVKAMEPFRVKFVASVVQIKGKMGNVALQIKAGGERGTQKIAEMYSKLVMMARSQIELFAVKMADARSMAAAGTWRVAGPCITFVKNGYTYAIGKASGVVIRAKALGDSTRQKALEAYAGACQKVNAVVQPVLSKIGEIGGSVYAKIVAVFNPYLLKIKNGVVSLKAKFGQAYIAIQVRLSETLKAALATVEPCVIRVRTAIDKTASNVVSLKAHAVERLCDAKASAVTAVQDVAKVAQLKVAVAKTTIADKRFKATAGSAAVGVAAGGVSGGSVGFVAGGAVGAAIGVVPAIFTFGLSIPIGAALGSGTGLCIGTVAGSTAGLVGGGAAGYGVQKHKAEIDQGVSGAFAKMNEYKNYAKTTAKHSTTALKTKLIGATGGTEGSLPSMGPPEAIGGTDQ